MAIVLKTVFALNEKNISGYMFVLAKQESFVLVEKCSAQISGTVRIASATFS